MPQKKKKKERYKYPTRELLAVWMILQTSCQKSISEGDGIYHSKKEISYKTYI